MSKLTHVVIAEQDGARGRYGGQAREWEMPRMPKVETEVEDRFCPTFFKICFSKKSDLNEFGQKRVKKLHSFQIFDLRLDLEGKKVAFLYFLSVVSPFSVFCKS
jgi:hypothetical protein